MAQWGTSLISVVVGAVAGIALEPAKSYLLERFRIKQMRNQRYEQTHTRIEIGFELSRGLNLDRSRSAQPAEISS